MKVFYTVALFVFALSVNIFGQRTASTTEWEVTFGRSWGRVHEKIVLQTINSEGRITYLDKRNGTPAVGQISQRQVDEIAALLDRLNLPAAKNIPSKEFNKCIVSPHLPDTYFSLIRNNKKYNLSHCNNFSGKDYQYTLNLSVKQKAIYKSLREMMEYLFDDKFRDKAVLLESEKRNETTESIGRFAGVGD